MLTPGQREQLGNRLAQCHSRLGTVGIWTELHEVSVNRAVVEVARLLNLLEPTTAGWLLREIGEEPTPPGSPHWDGAKGELRLEGEVIRRVRVTQNLSNVQRILDAFQAERWTSPIDNPLKRGPEQLHQTLRSLNTDLKGVRFHAQKGGCAVTWERI